MPSQPYGFVYANVLPSTGSPVTATGNSGAVKVINTQKVDNLSVILNFTAVTGTTPSLTASVEWSNDGTNFVAASTPDSFTAITAAGSALKQFTVKGAYFRVVYTVTGTTPSFTGTASAFVN